MGAVTMGVTAAAVTSDVCRFQCIYAFPPDELWHVDACMRRCVIGAPLARSLQSTPTDRERARDEVLCMCVVTDVVGGAKAASGATKNAGGTSGGGAPASAWYIAVAPSSDAAISLDHLLSRPPISPEAAPAEKPIESAIESSADGACNLFGADETSSEPMSTALTTGGGCLTTGSLVPAAGAAPVAPEQRRGVEERASGRARHSRLACRRTRCSTDHEPTHATAEAAALDDSADIWPELDEWFVGREL